MVSKWKSPVTTDDENEDSEEILNKVIPLREYPELTKLQKLGRHKQLAFEDFNWKIKCQILQWLISTDKFHIMLLFAPVSINGSLSPMYLQIYLFTKVLQHISP